MGEIREVKSVLADSRKGGKFEGEYLGSKRETRLF